MKAVVKEEQDGNTYLSTTHSDLVWEMLKIKNPQKDIPKIAKAIVKYWRENCEGNG